MDFYRIQENSPKRGLTEIRPDFLVKRSKDLMVRGGSFYAIWDEEQNMWSSDEFRVVELIDKDLFDYAEKLRTRTNDAVIVKSVGDFGTGVWDKFQRYVTNVPNNFTTLNRKIIFADTKVTKSDYASVRLPYSMKEGSTDAYDEMMSTLYNPSEREKIEWAIGSIFAGDSSTNDKFIVLYGKSGTGKSTVIKIIEKLFAGYFGVFDAKSLGQVSNNFSLEVLKSNPLVAIQHDGDLSRIEDNTRLNSLTSHETMVMNEKHKSQYSMSFDSFLFMGTNKPVKITDSKSGISRRLIDVTPSGRLIPPKHYFNLMSKIDFELGAIAKHCFDVYLSRGKNYYKDYRPLIMMQQTDSMYNFVEEHYYDFSKEDGVSLKQAWEAYLQYVDDSGFKFKLNKMEFKAELSDYFDFYEERKMKDSKAFYNYFSGFKKDKFEAKDLHPDKPLPLVLDMEHSRLDDILGDCPAQYAKKDDTPSKPWEKVKTTLDDLDTSKTHYILIPKNHIVVDFDLKDETGEKNAELNLEAAAQFPPTYAEYSKGGSGVHLHYIYDGDTSKLANEYKPGIEIKVFRGKAALRRRLSKCNNLEVAHISNGLPEKEEKVIIFKELANEKALRTLIKKNLRKEIHPGTKPSVDFIFKILDDAYFGGKMSYDVTDMRPAIMQFAMGSTHHAEECVKTVSKMHFQSEGIEQTALDTSEAPIIFFDVEVFPNLFVVCYKMRGHDEAVRMINPTPNDIEDLCNYNLIGFNNRRYDNHILYGRMLGYDNEQLYHLSKRIIDGSKNATFAQAYGISYTDIYDFSSKKQSLKKFEIELGIFHKENNLPWDEPVKDEDIPKVVEYCANDVIATEKVFEARKADFIAREILAKLSGLTVNDTTQKHTARIIFEHDRNPQKHFVYTDLSEMFYGYKFDKGQSTYRGEIVGEGGYVYAEPGIYYNVALLDITSMHPNSIIQLNLFGKYTEKFKNLLDARTFIKHKEFGKARIMMDGILAPYLDDESDADDLAYALKIVINIIYGLTSAKFDNPFRDVRNIDNIVAKRGALFMIDLKNALQERGCTVAHIKTDSVKIPNATPDDIRFVQEFGAKYGYTFEHEATYEKMCLVNDAVYIAKADSGEWTATGAQFKHPYVFKTLFTGESITLDDISEAKATTSAFYLDFNENLGEDEHNYVFVGKVGAFVPVMPGEGGGLLMRVQEGAYHSATGTKGYRWLETETAKERGDHLRVDLSYGQNLVDKAIEAIAEYGNVDEFIDRPL